MTIATVRDHVGRPGAVLSPSETARLLREDHGVTDAELAHQVHELTGGWPVLVELAGEALTSHRADRRDLLTALTGPTTRLKVAAQHLGLFGVVLSGQHMCAHPADCTTGTLPMSPPESLPRPPWPTPGHRPARRFIDP